MKLISYIAHFIASPLTDKFITLRLPRWRLLGGGVELVIEQTEGLLTAERVPGKQRAVAGREFDFYVHAVRRAPVDERRPQPVVHVVVRHVAHNVTPPIYSFVEICEGLLDPLQHEQQRTEMRARSDVSGKESSYFSHQLR